MKAGLSLVVVGLWIGAQVLLAKPGLLDRLGV